jgi:hypothetical protein
VVRTVHALEDAERPPVQGLCLIVLALRLQDGRQHGHIGRHVGVVGPSARSIIASALIEVLGLREPAGLLMSYRQMIEVRLNHAGHE